MPTVNQFHDELHRKATGLGGVVASVRRLDVNRGYESWYAYGVRSRQFYSGAFPVEFASEEQLIQLPGYGCNLDQREALTRAIAECVERMCAASWLDGSVIEAEPYKLGDQALDLTSLPVCSSEELKQPNCSILSPSLTESLRWVEGFRAGCQEKCWIPLVLSHTHCGRTLPGEHFTHSISTGCATHISPDRAITSAILELVERDAMALTWLLRRVVSRIQPYTLDAESASLYHHHQLLTPQVRLELFDITTDLPWPVVMCLQTQYMRPHAYSLLTCSSALSYPEAIQKVLCDAMMCRFANTRPKSFPRQVQRFTTVSAGAAYMAESIQRPSFAFLTETTNERDWRALQNSSTAQKKHVPESMLEELKKRNMEVYLVDLTTPEAKDLGLFTYRAIIPALQPISFHQSAKFLGHMRLRDFRQQSGHSFAGGVSPNPDPLPFA